MTKKRTPELVAEVLRLRQQGMSMRAIGRQLGVSDKTIRRWTDPEAAEKNREYNRKYREANHEKELERIRKWKEANREEVREYNRKYHEANVLKHAKGKPLRSDYLKAARPHILTRLLLKVAKDFCLEWNFPVEQMFDEVVLRSAARTVRESPFLNGERNPWYGTDYLHESTVTSRVWAYKLARSWRNRV